MHVRLQLTGLAQQRRLTAVNSALTPDHECWACLQVVGVGSLFFWPAPVLLKQGYLVVTGVVTAYMFTFVPEWTTWTLLISMALYDLYAVLVPGGPLKVSLL